MYISVSLCQSKTNRLVCFLYPHVGTPKVMQFASQNRRFNVISRIGSRNQETKRFFQSILLTYHTLFRLAHYVALNT